MKPLGWQPKQTITINLSELEEHAPGDTANAVTQAARIRTELARILGPNKSVTEVSIGGFMVTFADGMRWNGLYLNPDLSRQPSDYFPGDVNTPWWPK